LDLILLAKNLSFTLSESPNDIFNTIIQQSMKSLSSTLNVKILPLIAKVQDSSKILVIFLSFFT